MLTGCVQRVFFPQVNAATARVLAAEGCDVIIPAGQGCCGALSLHGGRRAEAARFARRTIEEFERAAVDAIVVNVAGCGSAMKEYAELLADDPGWSERAAALAGKVRDLSEFLAELGPAAPRHPLDITVAYHDACHLAHAQRITAQPRELAGRDTRAAPGGHRRRRHLLRLGRHLQPGPAGARPRAGRAQGHGGRGHRGGPAGVRQPGLRDADHLGARGARHPDADGAHRRGARRVPPRPRRAPCSAEPPARRSAPSDEPSRGQAHPEPADLPADRAASGCDIMTTPFTCI